MILEPAPGGPEMREAHASPFVQVIGDFLYGCLENNNEDMFVRVASFLRKHKQSVSIPAPVAFTEELLVLRDLHNRLDASGNLPAFPHISETLQKMYEQDEVRLGFQRGAIVERLVWKLVNSRSDNGDCRLNHRLVDARFRSRQVDVIVLAQRMRQIEGYSCKVDHFKLKKGDCQNLMDLSYHGINIGFSSHLGVVSFYSSEAARKKLQELEEIKYEFEHSIIMYGVGKIHELKKDPFRRR